MPDADPLPGDPSASERDGWDNDPWKDDAWKRDRWKEQDWGKSATPDGGGKGPQRKPGLAGWNTSMMEAGPYLSLGLQTAFSMVFFVGIGYLIDGWLGSKPWGIIIGALLGMVGVISLLVRLSNQANAQARADKEKRER